MQWGNSDIDHYCPNWTTRNSTDTYSSIHLFTGALKNCSPNRLKFLNLELLQMACVCHGYMGIMRRDVGKADSWRKRRGLSLAALLDLFVTHPLEGPGSELWALNQPFGLWGGDSQTPVSFLVVHIIYSKNICSIKIVLINLIPNQKVSDNMMSALKYVSLDFHQIGHLLHMNRWHSKIFLSEFFKLWVCVLVCARVYVQCIFFSFRNIFYID